MSHKVAQADVAHIRQTTQFTCCATSITSALHALGKKFTEDEVNKVLGAAPMAGATWEAMLATVQYFGCRGTLVVPATPRMLKAWTDQGLPVLIAWNPENRPWSHASVVFDVVEGADGVLQVHVMDPNIPNPARTVRVLNEDEFCQKWGEKVSDTLIVRRPAMVVEREVTVAGRQVKASVRMAPIVKQNRLASLQEPGTPQAFDPTRKSQLESPMSKSAKAPTPVGPAKKDPNKFIIQPTRRNPVVQQMLVHGPGGTGTHHTRDLDVAKGVSRKNKHKKPWEDREAALRVAARFLAEQE